MALAEAFGNSAGDLSGMGVKLAAGVGGAAAVFSLHESIDTDEQAIIFSRGRVNLNRDLIEKDFDTRSVRKARKLITALALETDEPVRKYMAEYARIYESSGRFKLWNMRSIRKIKTNDQNSALPKQRLVLGDETWEVDGNVSWVIEPKGQNAARALLNAESQEEVTQRVVTTTARAVLESLVDMDGERGQTPRESIFSSSKIFERMPEKCSGLGMNYGVKLLDYELGSFGPTESQTGVNGWDRILDKHFPPGPGGARELIEGVVELRPAANE